MKQIFDVLIIGAGASGTFCALNAAQRGRKVAVLEHNGQSLRKVSVSGGGKCNFTNLGAGVDNYVSENGRFVISALQQFSAQDFLEFVTAHKLPWQEKSPGQLFAKSAQDIIKVLRQESHNVSYFFDIEIKQVSRAGHFCVNTNQGEFEAKALVVATGGASYPALGASEYGYQLAKQFGHKVIPFKPSLVPLNLDSELMKKVIKLQGVSLPVKVSCGQFSIKDQILFTHFGLSGPAILQASLYWNKGQPIVIDLWPGQDAATFLLEQKRTNPKKKINLLLKTFFPDRIIEFLLEGQNQFIAEVADCELRALGQKINQWQVVPVGTQSFKLAEVTKGGVDVNEVSSKTMQSRKVEGLYFIGEVLDVTGQLGGYNLQWAWSSGWVCSQNV